MHSTNFNNEYRLYPKLMGSAFELVVVHQEAEKAKEILDSGVQEVQRIEKLLSEFIPTSATSIINQNAGLHPVKVEQEVFDLILRCQHLSKLTQGAFDITVSPLKKIYPFKKKEFQIPNSILIKETLNHVGYQNLILNSKDTTAFLKKKKMHISFAAIGKGYAADCVKKIWRSAGVHSGVVNASGDLTSFGKRADGSQWKLGIPNPDNKKDIKFQLPIENTSVATSGDYEQFFMQDGIRYSHTIHPKTGLPVSGIKSVSIFSPKAELSDALATAVFVMGRDTGLHFINQLPKTHCIIIDDNDESWFSQEIRLGEVQHPKSEDGKTENRVPLFSNLRSSVFGLLAFLFLSACTTLAPYERIYLNDSEMQMGQNSVNEFEHYILTIREGATPANGTKTSGGCGCN